MHLGAIADDVTGGTDLASLIRRAGLNVVQLLDASYPVPAGTDAAVISLKTRTAPIPVATELSIQAARRLQEAGAQQLYVKYCSTFDSTDSGNIGPVIDALLGVVDASFTVACPAYPALARTVYAGHLFVGHDLLSESSMRHHPLTPMTDSNLVRVLQHQTRCRVGLVSLRETEEGPEVVRARFEALARQGIGVAIVDAVFDRHIDTIAAASRELRLVTGGAALGGALARQAGVHSDEQERPVITTPGPFAIFSGSCSAATQAQVRSLGDRIPVQVVNPLKLVDDPQEEGRLIDWAIGRAGRGPLMLHSTGDHETVMKVQDRLGRAESAAILEQTFGHLARALAEYGVRTFVIAGGETSGAVLQALGVRALTFGDDVDPGVPWTASLDPPGFVFALKSGNFGSPDFFARALGKTA
jgi:uncharacterized protein YgbK (DUF1537 family)